MTALLATTCFESIQGQVEISYLPEEFGQMSLSKQCRSDAVVMASDQCLHCSAIYPTLLLEE